jgi:CRISPR-associated endonuclease/helicase Cas3
MFVLFISECKKNALKKTRGVLDLFATRIGRRTWKTFITQEGLIRVKLSLSKVASKNTSVICHWIRGINKIEVVWVVGNRDVFSHDGKIPIAKTKRNIINTELENDWKYLPLIKSLAALAALFHDYGKASDFFQKKLRKSTESSNSNKGKFEKDPLRHELVSCILLRAFIDKRDDEIWISDLSEKGIDEKLLLKKINKINFNKESEINPFLEKNTEDLIKIADLIVWLILTHHKLPNPSNKDNHKGESSEKISNMLSRIKSEWGYYNKYQDDKLRKKCLSFRCGLLANSNIWIKEVKKWSTKLKNCINLFEELKSNKQRYRVILFYSRLSLMLGDHNYSKEGSSNGEDSSNDILYANTKKSSKNTKAKLNQKLDDHLVGVAKSALTISHFLPKIESTFPYSNQEIKFFKKSSDKFKWQEKASNKISEHLDQNNLKNGFFGINMASTGCGKTLANAKIMMSLSDKEGSFRFSIALGLRTLTLQTGNDYRDKIGLSDEELAVLIGSQAVLDLEKQNNDKNQNDNDDKIKNKSDEEFSGSESVESLFDINEHVIYQELNKSNLLSTVIKDEKSKKFLYAPVLVCTIDYLVKAVQTTRGGRYILPSLRLMSSDLVIDEIDDFDSGDLIVIGRLIHLAGMLGRKVVISSATIPEAMAECYFKCYSEGWALYNTTRTMSNSDIDCAWIDEFNTEIEKIHLNDFDSYKKTHSEFIDKRIKKLEKQPIKRKAEIIPITQSNNKNDDKNKEKAYFFESIKNAISKKHQNHNTEHLKTRKRISFGLIRMANVDPCIELTKYLIEKWNDSDEDLEIKVMTYHQKQVLILRNEQERYLDKILKRKECTSQEPKAFQDETIIKHIKNSKSNNIAFIVIATPIEEIGRDHDFDWAIIEPSSFRSIIQIAGRVMRHRVKEITEPNIALLEYNLKAFMSKDKSNSIPYSRPGYNGRSIILKTHSLEELLKTDYKILDNINAIPRIKARERDNMNPENNLIDLEHYVINKLLNDDNGNEQYSPESINGYIKSFWWLTGLPQMLVKFRENQSERILYRVYDEDEDEFLFSEDCQNKENNRNEVLNISETSLSEKSKQRLWIERDYKELIMRQIEIEGIDMKSACIKYGVVSVRYMNDKEKQYNDNLGLLSKRL